MTTPSFSEMYNQNVTSDIGRVTRTTKYNIDSTRFSVDGVIAEMIIEVDENSNNSEQNSTKGIIDEHSVLNMEDNFYNVNGEKLDLSKRAFAHRLGLSTASTENGEALAETASESEQLGDSIENTLKKEVLPENETVSEKVQSSKNLDDTVTEKELRSKSAKKQSEKKTGAFITLNSQPRVVLRRLPGRPTVGSSVVRESDFKFSKKYTNTGCILKLENIASICDRVRSAKQDVVKSLYQVMYNHPLPNDVNEIVVKVLQFSGFSFDAISFQYGKRKRMIKTFSEETLQHMCGILGVKLGPKSEMIDNILHFLLKPTEKLSPLIDSAYQPVISLTRLDSNTIKAICDELKKESKKKKEIVKSFNLKSEGKTAKMEMKKKKKLKLNKAEKRKLKKAVIRKLKKAEIRRLMKAEKKKLKKAEKRKLKDLNVTKRSTRNSSLDQKAANDLSTSSWTSKELVKQEEKFSSISSVSKKLKVTQNVFKTKRKYNKLKNKNKIKLLLTDASQKHVNDQPVVKRKRGRPRLQKNLPVLDNKILETNSSPMKVCLGKRPSSDMERRSPEKRRRPMHYGDWLNDETSDILIHETSGLDEVSEDEIIEIPIKDENSEISSVVEHEGINENYLSVNKMEAEVKEQVPVSPTSSIKSDETPKEKVKGAKLGSFPQIVKSIESITNCVLQRLHVILFGTSLESEKMKKNVLSFDGFPFDKDSEEWQEKHFFLSLSACNNLLEVFEVLHIEISDDSPSALVDTLMNFLLSPHKDLLDKSSFLEENGRKISSKDKKKRELKKIAKNKKKKTDHNKYGPRQRKVLMDEATVRKLELELAREQRARRRASLQSTSFLNPQVHTAKYKTAQVAPKTVQPHIARVEDTVSLDKSSRQKVKLGDNAHVKFMVVALNYYDLDVIHHLIFLQSAVKSKIRRNILEFSGFTFDERSPRYEVRKTILRRLGYEMVRRLAFIFGIASRDSNRSLETLCDLIMQFLCCPGRVKQVPATQFPHNFLQDYPQDFDMKVALSNIPKLAQVMQEEMDDPEVSGVGLTVKSFCSPKLKGDAPQLKGKPVSFSHTAVPVAKVMTSDTVKMNGIPKVDSEEQPLEVVKPATQGTVLSPEPSSPQNSVLYSEGQLAPQSTLLSAKWQSSPESTVQSGKRQAAAQITMHSVKGQSSQNATFHVVPNKLHSAEDKIKVTQTFSTQQSSIQVASTSKDSGKLQQASSSLPVLVKKAESPVKNSSQTLRINSQQVPSLPPGQAFLLDPTKLMVMSKGLNTNSDKHIVVSSSKSTNQSPLKDPVKLPLITKIKVPSSTEQSNIPQERSVDMQKSPVSQASKPSVQSQMAGTSAQHPVPFLGSCLTQAQLKTLFTPKSSRQSLHPTNQSQQQTVLSRKSPIQSQQQSILKASISGSELINIIPQASSESPQQDTLQKSLTLSQSPTHTPVKSNVSTSMSPLIVQSTECISTSSSGEKTLDLAKHLLNLPQFQSMKASKSDLAEELVVHQKKPNGTEEKITLLRLPPGHPLLPMLESGKLTCPLNVLPLQSEGQSSFASSNYQNVPNQSAPSVLSVKPKSVTGTVLSDSGYKPSFSTGLPSTSQVLLHSEGMSLSRSDDDDDTALDNPSDDALFVRIRDIIHAANLEDLTLKKINEKLMSEFPGLEISSRRPFIKSSVKNIICGMTSTS